MKKRLLSAALALALAVACLAGCGAASEEKTVAKALGLEKLPAVTHISSYDSHGGFHGDGILTAVVKLPNSQAGENAVQSIAEQWKPLPIEEDWMEQFQSVWTDHGQTLGVLPQNTEGFWFYRDRYKERYGEVCYPNPVMQNCTFAMLDTDSGVLYVLEVDC